MFPGSVPLEDLFTEAVARLFETRPQLCLAWLTEVKLLSEAQAASADEGYVRVVTQRSFEPLEHHGKSSRPDLLIEVYWTLEEGPVEDKANTLTVIVESKIGSKEGSEQLRRYTEHLARMPSAGGKTLLYVTRGYDPKDPMEILLNVSDDVRFQQLRWHDFYRFLQKVEKDALVKEVMSFMEEQGMARSYHLSAQDLIALSGVPRAFEILDETLGGEVKGELESFAGNKTRRESVALDLVRQHGLYATIAPLHGDDLRSYVGYQMLTPSGYPEVLVGLQTRPNAVGRDASITVMKRIVLRDGWEGHELDDPTAWSRISRARSLASLLSEEDHIAAAKSFFIESIRQLREELTTFKKDHPALPWAEG